MKDLIWLIKVLLNIGSLEKVLVKIWFKNLCWNLGFLLKFGNGMFSNSKRGICSEVERRFLLQFEIIPENFLKNCLILAFIILKQLDNDDARKNYVFQKLIFVQILTNYKCIFWHLKTRIKIKPQQKRGKQNKT